MSDRIDCTGDVVVGDVITFTEGVFAGSFRSATYRGDRKITASVTKDSYGAAKQQHTFSLEIIASSGIDPLTPGTKTTRKGRNVYRNGTTRRAWTDESARSRALDEKHERGDRARADRGDRRQCWP